jgi:hypothetical protein
VCKKWALENIRKRRLKLSRINDLNDPFELLGMNMEDSRNRVAFQANKDWLAERNGILCFSSDWSNPVMWSHYADRHKGICLGFEVSEKHLHEVKYAVERPSINVKDLVERGKRDPSLVMPLTSTKFEHWKYEKEFRAYLQLQDEPDSNGLYYAEFSNDLKLAQVIAGACSNVTRAEVADALGALSHEVEVFKARPAFKAFKVVRNQDDSLWA